MKKGTLYTDGGSRGNPGPAALGFELTVGKQKPIAVGRYIGSTTNNQAEYQALIAGLKRARKEKVTHLKCYLDSELIVKQISREYRVRDKDLRPLFDNVCKLIEKFDNISFTHIRRNKNKVADSMVNEALDRNT